MIQRNVRLKRSWATGQRRLTNHAAGDIAFHRQKSVCPLHETPFQPVLIPYFAATCDMFASP